LIDAFLLIRFGFYVWTGGMVKSVFRFMSVFAGKAFFIYFVIFYTFFVIFLSSCIVTVIFSSTFLPKLWLFSFFFSSFFFLSVLSSLGLISSTGFVNWYFNYYILTFFLFFFYYYSKIDCCNCYLNFGFTLTNYNNFLLSFMDYTER